MGVVLLLRHGARSISSSAAEALLQTSPAAGAGLHAVDSWHPSEREAISPVGEEQVRLIGEWFATRYLPQHAPNVLAGVHANTGLKWRSSTTLRVLASGRTFLDSFSSSCGNPHCNPSAPLHYESEEATTARFLGYRTARGYPEFLGKMRTSVEFERAALKVRAQLESIYDKLSGAGCAAAGTAAAVVAADGINADTSVPGPESMRSPVPDSSATAALSGDGVHGTADGGIDPSHDDEDTSLALKLANLYYVKEIYDCECHWASTAAAVRNDVAPATGAASNALVSASSLGREAQHPSGASIAVVSNPKNVFLSRLSAADEAFINHASRWVWDQRYFSYPGVRSFAGSLGGPVVAEMVSDLNAIAHPSGSSSSRSAVSPLSVYTGHDHSIFGALAALKVPSAPSSVLGFGAYLILELWRKPASDASSTSAAAAAGTAAGFEYSVTAKLNDQPFPRAREGRPTDLEPGRAVTLFEDVSLDGLMALVARYK